MYHEVTGSGAIGYLATKPVMIITTLHETGIVNAGVFGAYTNMSAEHVGVACHTSSHTLANIRRSGEFVINVPGADLVKSLAIIASDIPPSESEIDAAGLSCRDGVVVQTSSIAQCQAAVELKFTQEVTAASHVFVIGTVVGGWIKSAVLDEDGAIDIFKARVIKDFKYPKPLYIVPGDVIQG